MLFFISHHFRIICWSSVTSIIVTLQSSGVYCVTSASLSYATSLAMHPCLHERKFTSALYGWTVLFICFGYCLLTSLLGPKDRKCKWMIDWLIDVLLASGRKGTTSSDLRAINPDTQRTHIAHEVKSTWAEEHHGQHLADLLRDDTTSRSIERSAAQLLYYMVRGMCHAFATVNHHILFSSDQYFKIIAYCYYMLVPMSCVWPKFALYPSASCSQIPRIAYQYCVLSVTYGDLLICNILQQCVAAPC